MIPCFILAINTFKLGGVLDVIKKTVFLIILIIDLDSHCKIVLLYS